MVRVEMAAAARGGRAAPRTEGARKAEVMRMDFIVCGAGAEVTWVVVGVEMQALSLAFYISLSRSWKLFIALMSSSKSQKRGDGAIRDAAAKLKTVAAMVWSVVKFASKQCSQLNEKVGYSCTEIRYIRSVIYRIIHEFCVMLETLFGLVNFTGHDVSHGL